MYREEFILPVANNAVSIMTGQKESRLLNEVQESYNVSRRICEATIM